MKKYIKPATEWLQIENSLPLATSDPKIDPTPPWGDASAKGNDDADWGYGESTDEEGEQWDRL